jgi:hypothetical protein
MRFLITAAPDPKAPPASNQPPSDDTFVAYMRFNEELHRAGVLIASEGVNPAAKGARVVVSNGERTVVDGPYTESKELVGGFYLIEVTSLEVAIQWALRCPVGLGSADVLTIHPMTEPSDIPPQYLDVIRKAAPTWSEAFRAKR